MRDTMMAASPVSFGSAPSPNVLPVASELATNTLPKGLENTVGVTLPPSLKADVLELSTRKASPPVAETPSTLSQMVPVKPSASPTPQEK
jgi:hypothetical protein